MILAPEEIRTGVVLDVVSESRGISLVTHAVEKVNPLRRLFVENSRPSTRRIPACGWVAMPRPTARSSSTQYTVVAHIGMDFELDEVTRNDEVVEDAEFNISGR